MHIERQFEVVPPATPPLGVMLSGDTRVFPVIGDPIGQVRSPRFLTEILVDRGENAIVFPAHVSPEHLQRTLTVTASASKSRVSTTTATPGLSPQRSTNWRNPGS